MFLLCLPNLDNSLDSLAFNCAVSSSTILLLPLSLSLSSLTLPLTFLFLISLSTSNYTLHQNCWFFSGATPCQEHWSFQPYDQHLERSLGTRHRPSAGLPGGLCPSERCQAFWIGEFPSTVSPCDFIHCLHINTQDLERKRIGPRWMFEHVFPKQLAIKKISQHSQCATCRGVKCTSPARHVGINVAASTVGFNTSWRSAEQITNFTGVVLLYTETLEHLSASQTSWRWNKLMLLHLRHTSKTCFSHSRAPWPHIVSFPMTTATPIVHTLSSPSSWPINWENGGREGAIM